MFDPPSISAPIGCAEKRKKTFESSSKMITKLFQSIFAKVKIVEPKNGQIFEFFETVKHRFEKTHYLKNYDS